MNLVSGIGKIEWIFFDLDGTLADSITPLFNVYRRFLKELAIPVDENDLSQLNGVSLFEIVSFLKSKYKVSQSQNDLYNLYKVRIAEAYVKEVKPMKHADKTLQLLCKSFKLQLVTSGDRGEAMSFIKKQGWLELFTSFVFGDEVRRGKPDPEIFQLAISRTGCQINSAITVEDSVNGVKASTAAGLNTIGFSNKTPSQDLVNAGASATIYKLDELIPLLTAMENQL